MAGAAVPAAQDNVVWKDEAFSIEERRAQLPKYANQVCLRRKEGVALPALH